MKSKLIPRASALILFAISFSPAHAQDSEVPIAAVKSQGDDTSVNVILTPIPGKQTTKQIAPAASTKTTSQPAAAGLGGAHTQKSKVDLVATSKGHEKNKEEKKSVEGTQRKEGNFSPVQYFNTQAPESPKETTPQAVTPPAGGSVFEEISSPQIHPARAQASSPTSPAIKIQKPAQPEAPMSAGPLQKKEEHENAKWGLLIGLLALMGGGLWLKSTNKKVDDADLVRKML